MIWRVPLIIILCGICMLGGCFKRKSVQRVEKNTLKGSGTVYLVPLGDFPPATIENLAEYYRKRYGIDIMTLPKLELPKAVKSDERKQLIAEELITLIKNVKPELVHDPKAFVIGLTNEDMFIQQRDWQYAYSWRHDAKYAVISSNRMNEGSLFRAASDELTQIRLRKMVTKNIGLLYFHLPQSDNPRSVLYGRVDSLKDLDKMGEEF